MLKTGDTGARFSSAQILQLLYFGSQLCEFLLDTFGQTVDTLEKAKIQAERG